LAETGARPSQAARLKIKDLVTANMNAPRLSMPRSAKGGTRDPDKRKAERYPVAISRELATLLKAAAKGRPSNAPLLVQKDGRAWDTSNKPSHFYRDAIRSIVAKIGLDDTFSMYSLRHTSITRMLLKGVQTAVVAKSHDTSEAMIRKHYAASILDHSDSLTRKTLPSLGPAAPAASNVVPLAKGR
jgi:integrase